MYQHGHDACLLSIGRAVMSRPVPWLTYTAPDTAASCATTRTSLTNPLKPHHIQWHRLYCTPWVSAPAARLLQRTNTADTATDAHELCLHVSPSVFSSGSSSCSCSSSPAPRCHRTTLRLPDAAVATVSLHLTAYHCIQLHSEILTKPQNGQGRAMPPPAYWVASLPALSTQTPFCQLDLDWDAHFALPCNPHNTTPLPFSMRDRAQGPRGCPPKLGPCAWCDKTAELFLFMRRQTATWN